MKTIQDYCFALALVTLRANAQDGNRRAMASLGSMYYRGLGVEQDYVEALRWYKEAAKLGKPSAMHMVGKMHQVGCGAVQDHSIAVDCFRRCAEKYPPARDDLGWHLYHGRGIERDRREAFRQWEAAADIDGYGYTQARLSRFYIEGGEVEENIPKGLRLLRLAVRKGEPTAQAYLGYLYLKGKVVRKDVKKAVRLFRKAANQGDMSGEGLLGNCYWNGYGIERDIVRAIYWFLLSAGHGQHGSMRCLADIYRGYSMYDMAEMWERKATEAEKMESCK